MSSAQKMDWCLEFYDPFHATESDGDVDTILPQPAGIASDVSSLTVTHRKPADSPARSSATNARPTDGPASISPVCIQLVDSPVKPSPASAQPNVSTNDSNNNFNSCLHKNLSTRQNYSSSECIIIEDSSVHDVATNHVHSDLNTSEVDRHAAVDLCSSSPTSLRSLTSQTVVPVASDDGSGKKNYHEQLMERLYNADSADSSFLTRDIQVYKDTIAQSQNSICRLIDTVFSFKEALSSVRQHQPVRTVTTNADTNHVSSNKHSSVGFASDLSAIKRRKVAVDESSSNLPTTRLSAENIDSGCQAMLPTASNNADLAKILEFDVDGGNSIRDSPISSICIDKILQRLDSEANLPPEDASDAAFIPVILSSNLSNGKHVESAVQHQSVAESVSYIPVLMTSNLDNRAVCPEPGKAPSLVSTELRGTFPECDVIDDSRVKAGNCWSADILPTSPVTISSNIVSTSEVSAVSVTRPPKVVRKPYTSASISSVQRNVACRASGQVLYQPINEPAKNLEFESSRLPPTGHPNVSSATPVWFYPPPPLPFIPQRPPVLTRPPHSLVVPYVSNTMPPYPSGLPPGIVRAILPFDPSVPPRFPPLARHPIVSSIPCPIPAVPPAVPPVMPRLVTFAPRFDCRSQPPLLPPARWCYPRLPPLPLKPRFRQQAVPNCWPAGYVPPTASSVQSMPFVDSQHTSSTVTSAISRQYLNQPSTAAVPGLCNAICSTSSLHPTSSSLVQTLPTISSSALRHDAGPNTACPSWPQVARSWPQVTSINSTNHCPSNPSLARKMDTSSSHSWPQPGSTVCSGSSWPVSISSVAAAWPQCSGISSGSHSVSQALPARPIERLEQLTIPCVTQSSSSSSLSPESVQKIVDIAKALMAKVRGPELLTSQPDAALHGATTSVVSHTTTTTKTATAATATNSRFSVPIPPPLPSVLDLDVSCRDALEEFTEGCKNVSVARTRRCTGSGLQQTSIPGDQVTETADSSVGDDVSAAAQNTTVTTTVDVPTKSAPSRSDKSVDRVTLIEQRVRESLRPFYKRGDIHKLEYKDVIRRAVPKIVASRMADPSSKRIDKFVSAYVAKLIHDRQPVRIANLSMSSKSLSASDSD